MRDTLTYLCVASPPLPFLYCLYLPFISLSLPYSLYLPFIFLFLFSSFLSVFFFLINLPIPSSSLMSVSLIFSSLSHSPFHFPLFFRPRYSIFLRFIFISIHFLPKHQFFPYSLLVAHEIRLQNFQFFLSFSFSFSLPHSSIS